MKIISRIMVMATAFGGLLFCGHHALAREKPEIVSHELSFMELFMTGKYQDLDREMNQVQEEFLKGKWDDVDLEAMMQQPFVATEPEFEEKYNSWLADCPKSYAARQARAYYYTAIADKILKGRKPVQLSEQELADVQRYADLAITDDRAALQLAQKPLAVYNNLIYLYALTGDWLKSRQMLDAADDIAPANTAGRYKYAHALSEFGHPLKEVEAFVDEVHKSGVAKKYLGDYDNILHWRLLQEGQYDRLDEAMNQVQQDYEDGKIDDKELDSYFGIFENANPTLEAVYNTWVEAHPKSYPAWQSRALYYTEVAMKSRGEKYASETSAGEMAGLEHYLKLAFENDKTAMSLTKKPIIAIKNIMIIERYAGSHDQCAQMAAIADKIDHKNMTVRQDYMRSMQGRWGGNLDEMQKYFEIVKTAGLSEDDIKDLEDMIITEKLWMADRKAETYSNIGKIETGF